MANISPLQGFGLVADAAYLSKRPPPIAPDGYYDWQISSDPADQREGHAAVTNLVNRVSRLPGCQYMFFHCIFKVEAFKAKGGYRPDPRRVVCAILCIIFHCSQYLSTGRIRGCCLESPGRR
jgi:hypothetical protein